MSNKWRFNFLLSSLGHLKRSSAGNRILQFDWGNRAVPSLWKRSLCIRNSLTPVNASVWTSCVRNLHFIRVKQREAVDFDVESDISDRDKNGSDSQKDGDDIKGNIEDGQKEWGYEDPECYSDYGIEPSNDCFNKNCYESGYNSKGFTPYEAFNKICSDDLKSHLKEMGIDQLHLFQLWAFRQFFKEDKNFRLIAKNGYGKTLLYSIVFVGRLLRTAGKEPGRPPQLLILVPSTEIAWEVLDMVELVTNKKLSVACIHDGVLRQEQESKISAGVDILIGMPHYVQNLVGKGILSLCDLHYAVFDGFDHKLKDQLPFILYQDETVIDGFLRIYDLYPEVFKTQGDSKANDDVNMKDQPLLRLLYEDQTGTQQRKIQTVTVLCDHDDNIWIRLARNYFPYCCWWPVLECDTNYAIEYQPSGQDAIVANLLQLHGGQAIIFADTEEDVDSLVLNRFIGEQLVALYSDSPHDRKQKILKDFQDGRFKCLVSTEKSPHVADFPSVELVIQLGASARHSTPVYRFNHAAAHPSVLLYQPSELEDVKNLMCSIIEQQNERYKDFWSWKISKEKQPEILSTMMTISLRSLSAVSESSEKHFTKAATGLIAQLGSVSAISSALAVIVDHVYKAK